MAKNISANVTTLEQARSLPEVFGMFCDEERVTDSITGITTVYRKPRPFVPRPTSGNEILMFIDVDGRPMLVTYTADGPAKCAWHG